MQTWRTAWDRANSHFYAHASPREHFRTSAHYPDLLAAGILSVILEALPDRTQPLTIVEVGADEGALARALAEHAQRAGWHCEVVAYDLRAGAGVTAARMPEGLAPGDVRGVLLAHEWLDDVACERVVFDDHCLPRLLLHDGERDVTGPRLADTRACGDLEVDADALLLWLQRWLPDARPGLTAEVGLARDDAWSTCLHHLREGVAVAIDYAVTPSERAGTGSRITGYAHGRRVPVCLDGTVNVTAHVAFDSLIAATTHLADRSTLLRQREALAATSRSEDGPLSAMAQASQLATLRSVPGLGSFRWLMQSR